MRCAIASSLLASGCFVQAAAGPRFHGASLRGGELASGRDDRVTAEFDATLAASPFSWIRGERETAPWVDAGALVGYGAGGTGDGAFFSPRTARSIRRTRPTRP